MILRLTLVSGEVEDFVLELKIDADSTFGDLHRLILKSCGYEETPGQRFFVCDDNWKPHTKILLEDDGNIGIDEDIYLMDDTDLGEFLEDEGQRLAYRFDPENRRMFLLELTQTIFGEVIANVGKLNRRHGEPPAQFISDEAPVVTTQASTISEELGEEFYGEDGFEEDEFDSEGYDIME